MTLSDKQLIDLALKVRTAKEVDGLERELQARGATDTRWLGNLRNAWSALSNEAPSWQVMLERVVNGMDAVIDLDVAISKIDPSTLRSPADAAHRAVGLPAGGVGGLKPKERRRFAERLELALYDTGHVTTPTVTTRDYGIGVTPANVPGTLLSLQGDDKLEKSYAHGVYGKGGSNTAVFCSRIVLITRRDPRTLPKGAADEIAITVVRRRKGDQTVKVPYLFDYLVTPSKLPLALPAKGLDFEPGTYIAHIEYEVDRRIARDQWLNDAGVQNVTETYLWNPTLPFLVRDHRRLMARGERVKNGEMLSGNGPKLDEVVAGGGRSASSKSAEPALVRWRTSDEPIAIPDLHGSVNVSWYVFPNNDRRRYYVSRGLACLFVRNGQVHDTWDADHFKSLVKARSVVAEHITVVVNCDDLPTPVAGLIFGSSRVSKRRSAEAQRLDERVVEWLSEDPELKDVEEQLQREKFANSAKTMSAEFLHRFNRLLAQRNRGIMTPDTDVEGPEPAPRPKIDRLDEPTYMHGPSASLFVVPGKITLFPLEINALDGFVPDHGRIVLEGVPDTSGIRYQPVHPLKRGRLGGWFDVAADAALGNYDAALSLTFISPRTAHERTLRFDIALHVATARQKAAAERKVTPRKPKKGHGQREGEARPNVAIIWDSLAPQTAAELRPISGDVLATKGYPSFEGQSAVPTVIVNDAYVEWARFRDRYLMTKTETMVKFHQEQYVMQLGLYVHDLVTGEEKLAAVQSASNASAAEINGAKAMSAEQQQRAITQTARAIVVALQPYSKLLDTLAPEERITAAIEDSGSR